MITIDLETNENGIIVITVFVQIMGDTIQILYFMAVRWFIVDRVNNILL